MKKPSGKYRAMVDREKYGWRRNFGTIDGPWRSTLLAAYNDATRIFETHDLDAVVTDRRGVLQNLEDVFGKNPMRHERIVSPSALRRRGLTKYRSKVTPSGHVLRIAYPEGRRRRGSGEVQAILHPENPSIPKWYVGLGENFDTFMKKTAHPIREPWIQAYGPFDTKAAAERVRARLWESVREERMRYTHNPSENPPKTKIYSRTIEIVASKAGMPHKCDAACKRAGHRYRHVFKDKKSGIYGLENGRILIGS